MDIMNLRPNDWVTCPYDPVHRMKYSKFHNHFVKCQKGHPDDNRKQCPYNFSELIEVEDYEEHLMECPYQTLYFNMGQVLTDLPKYDAPSHFNIADDAKVSLRERNLKTRMDFDSDEEFDSVSIAGNRGYRSTNGMPRKLPKKDFDVDVPSPSKSDLKSFDFTASKSPDKKGFGRGAWVRQMLNKATAAPAKTNCETENEKYEILKNPADDSKRTDQVSALIQQLRSDPLSISKRYGRGRGAIFRALLDG